MMRGGYFISSKILKILALRVKFRLHQEFQEQTPVRQ